jgi:hypothetical protein
MVPKIFSYFRASKASYYLSLLYQSEQFCLQGLQMDSRNTALQNLLKLLEEKKSEKFKKSEQMKKEKLLQESVEETQFNDALQTRG